MRWIPVAIAAGAVAIFTLLSSIFIVDEREQGLVLQFGEVKRIANEPGLYFRVPFIQEVAFYEDRILPVELSEIEVTPADERRLVVDAFARWRITDVVRFRQSVQTERSARQKLGDILDNAIRQVLGSVNQAQVLSPERATLMQRIRDVARTDAAAFGVEVVDVRIRRADLPEQNLNATFQRMEAERQREAADERARGKERAQEVRATADREATELVSDAQRQADIIRGTADAERNRVFAEAFKRDPEFFAFYRSLRAYENALKGENSTLVISPDSDFFNYLKTDTGRVER
ncbi:MAG: protease modulator HflC [Pseudomonadota bacterium]